ncbi:MAG TPA: hypothetical protein VHT28_15885 [Silvibacterium sp.]|jgi:hypothetical protein|nr:hypothetical protein [Silvibacterium sp.]
MTLHRLNARRFLLLALPLVLLSYGEAALAQKKTSYACKEPDPASLCTAANTCGSPSQPCFVDVKRTSNAASATPGIPGAKGNSTFCVKVDTSIIWHSDTKHQGFVVDMGPNEPFDPPGDIIGGSDKAVTVRAKLPGCFRFSAGACLSGAVYGMCGNGTAEIIIVK